MTSVLMVHPQNYRVEYAINPHMVDEMGNLKKVDSEVAYKQWKDLHDLYLKLGHQVYVLEGPLHLPDMVYSANNALPFINRKTKKKSVLMARMRSAFREPEIPLFEKWYRENGYTIEQLTSKTDTFEGCGDALLQEEKNILWGGFGPRTDRAVYKEIHERLDCEVLPLELVRSEFYHLDTCFAILNHETAVVQIEAFQSADVSLIRKHFKNVIPVDLTENLRTFAANCFSPNGKDVIIQRGAEKLVSQLKSHGFKIHEVETGEFLKGGGSVFCLKMALPHQ